MTLEYIDDDCTHDTGYGEHSATLWIEYKPIIEDVSFAHEFGTEVRHSVTGITIIGANLQCIGNNGNEIGGLIEIEEDEVYTHVSIEKLIAHAPRGTN